jgi:mono/diheme cytochrome c family protein
MLAQSTHAANASSRRPGRVVACPQSKMFSVGGTMTRIVRTKVRLASAVAAVCLAGGAFAQQPQLNETQTHGRELFLQSCGECHLQPQLGAPRYAPALSRDSAGGQESSIREVIANGTPRMPGFKYNFTPEQIASIAAYLKTVPPAASAASPAAAPANSREQD